MPEAMDVYKVGCGSIQNTKTCSNALVGEAPVPELQSAEDRTSNASVSKAKWLQAHRAASLLLNQLCILWQLSLLFVRAARRIDEAQVPAKHGGFYPRYVVLSSSSW